MNIQNKQLATEQFNAADALPPVLVGARAMLQAARDWAKRQQQSRLQAHFGWMTLRQKERARKAAERRREAVAKPVRLGPAGGLSRPVDLRGSMQHRSETAIKRFRMAASWDIWRRL